MNKYRIWAIRKLLGATDIEKVAKTTQATMYANIIQFLADKIAQDGQRYTNEYFARTLSDFKPEFLATAIEANKHLSATQREQIIYLLQAPQAEHQASYLG